MAIALCLSLLICSFALSASAAVLDSDDYISNISVDGNYDVVTLKFPKSGVWYGSHTEFYPDEFVMYLDSPALNVFYTPLRHMDGHDDFLSRSDFPDDTEFVIRFSCHSQNVPESGYINIMQFDSDMNVLDDPIDRIPITVETVSYLDNSWVTIRSGMINWHDDCSYFMINYGFTVNGVPSSAGDSSDVVYWYILQDADFSFTFKIESLVRQQQITNKQNAILNAVEKQLADQGKTLDEVLQQQQQTNDKLDDMQGSIETLPGQIGDEMQGIIDNEKEQSKGDGNKFVDQILDALPDPSTDVLAALKGLTDATAYTGTDAVLPIPAIVLPGIDGLFPETEIWGGTQFDFGESISMLPSTLLTLVQSLFTIAIVLYCVYELKGIISYCLTLRESKGG